MAFLEQTQKKFTIRGAATAFKIARNTLRKRLRATGAIPDERRLYSEEQIRTAIESGAHAHQMRSVAVSAAKIREIKARCVNVELKNERLLGELVKRSDIELELEKAFEHVSRTLADSTLPFSAKKDLKDNIGGWRERFEAIARSPGGATCVLDVEEEEDDGSEESSELQRQQDRESRARALGWELRNDLVPGVRLLRSDVFAAMELIFITITQTVYGSDLSNADKERLLNLISAWQASDQVITNLLLLCKPKELLLPSEWSERYRLAPSGSVKAGKWHNFPFQVQPMDAIASEEASSLTLMFASQLLGKSAIIESQLLWLLDQAPCPIVAVFPTLGNAVQWSKNRFSPLIDATERVSKLVDQPKSKKTRGSGENTITHKKFRGGWLLAGGSNSPANLRAHTARVTVFDEVDGYPDSSGDEGDVITLVEQRSIRYPDSFSVKTSTPGAKGFSRIEKEWESTDRRVWEVRCPRCAGPPFVINWSHLQWPKTKGPDGKTTRHHTRDAYLVCPSCEAHLSEAERIAMVEAGEWVPLSPEVTGRRGYKANAFLVLGPCKRGFKSWMHFFASEFLVKRKLGVAGMRPFTNLILGESYELEGATPPPHLEIFNRRETYAEFDGELVLPAACGLIVGGVDVQRDRLECELVGYSEHDESFGLQYAILPGNPELQAVWSQLYTLLTKSWRHPSGHMLSPFYVCIDAGYLDYIVARFCKNTCRRDLTVCSTIGRRGFDRQWWRKSKTDPLLTLIGVDYPKEMIYRRLRITEPGPEYCHFPSNERAGYNAEYFQGLTIEVMKTEKASPYFTKRHPEDRNEPLDIRALCVTAKELANPNWPRVRQWLATPPTNDWRPEQDRKKELLNMPIPDLRDTEQNMAALRSQIRESSKRWCKVT
jgi:phage terminase large subunit GpA-like protein